ncbi:MAG TPA: DUF4136 domain-containing protein [Candidatus Krumholzibacteria bacterium]|nr:DUF4136 domain-containing protein [Candidatus Krumholzibacteria bacterium]
MKRFVPLLIILTAMLLASCSERGFNSRLNIESQLVPGVDFGGYHTWKFAREEEYPRTGIDILDEPAYRESVAKLMIGQMDQLGYQSVTADPDMVIILQLMVEQKFDEQKMNDVYQGYDMAWAQMGGDDYWKEGSLYMFAMDAKTGRQIWSSKADAKLDEQASSSTKKERFKKVITMMLEDFPPATK